MHFGEFNNPLDVLAAAATLQSTNLSHDTSDATGNQLSAAGSGHEGSSESQLEEEDGAETEGKESLTASASAIASDHNVLSEHVMTPQTNSLCDSTQDKETHKKNITVSDSFQSESKETSQQTPRLIKVVSNTANLSKSPTSANNTVIKLQEPIKLAVTAKEPHSLSVLKIPKVHMGGGVDHSYAFSNAVPVERHHGRLETDDDGYCSRSSLDSPGQSSRSDGDTNDQDIFSDTDMRSPTTPVVPSVGLKTNGVPSSSLTLGTPLKLKTNVVRPSSPQLSPQTVSVLGKVKKPTKIVIVSRDSKRKQMVSSGEGDVFQVSDSVDKTEGDHDDAPHVQQINTCSPHLQKNVHTVMEPVDSWAGYSEPQPLEDRPSSDHNHNESGKEIGDTAEQACLSRDETERCDDTDKSSQRTNKDESPIEENIPLCSDGSQVAVGVNDDNTTVDEKCDSCVQHDDVDMNIDPASCAENASKSHSILPSTAPSHPSSSAASESSSSTQQPHTIKLITSNSAKVSNSNAVFIVKSLPLSASSSSLSSADSCSDTLSVSSSNKYIIEDDLPPLPSEPASLLTENSKPSFLSAASLSTSLGDDDDHDSDEAVKKDGCSSQLSQTLNSIVLAGPLVKPIQPNSVLTTSRMQITEKPSRATSLLLATDDSEKPASLLDGSCKLLLVKHDAASGNCNTRSITSPLLCRTPSPMLSSTVLPHPSTPGSAPPVDVAASSSNNSSKINIKISGSRVIDVTCTDDQGVSVKKAAASIGRMGSLSWQPIASSPDTLNMSSPSAVKESAPYLRILSGSPLPQGSVAVSPSLTSTPSCSSTTSLLQQPVKRPYHRKPKTSLTSKSLESTKSGENTGSEKDEGGSRNSCHTYVRKRQKMRGPGMLNLTPSQRELSKLKLSAQLIPHLHPLIDHDYCAFSDFSAEVQRSIIATTHNKVRIEKKFGKKAKAARTKGTGRTISPNMEEICHSEATESSTEKPKKRKYTKRKLTKKMLAEALANGEDITEKSQGLCKKDSDNVPKSKEALLATKLRKRQLAMEKKMSKYTPYRERPDKNYVKIPGSYQDDFVYYATRKTQKRQRKVVESLPEPVKGLPSRSQMVGAINEFDWYHEMARMDKTKFGVCSSVASDSNPGTPTPEPEKAFLSVDKGSTMLSPKLDDQSRYIGTTPTRESDVVDLVVDMELENSNSGTIMSGEENQSKSEQNGCDDLNIMAEQVRLMLNSMDETELQQLTENLGNKDSKDNTASSISSAQSESFPAILDQGPTLSQTSSGSQLLGDLDDINDSDLLSPDLGSDIGMSMEMLSDLPTASTITPATTSNANSAISAGASQGSYITSVPMTLSVNEPVLMSSQSDSSCDTPSTPGTPLLTPSAAPELTMVNMYWNDLPGLTINGKQYVRLVDIHKQVLPAKDTGILKKRCQMMGLEILNCSELQRDFLIRYMNAAKSKSCVITAKEDAKTLIGFYVDPRPRLPRGQTAECDSDLETDGVRALQMDKARGIGKKDETSHVASSETSSHRTQLAGTQSPLPKLKKLSSQREIKKAPVRKMVNFPSSYSASLTDKRTGLRQTRKVPYAALHHGVLEPAEDDPSYMEEENVPPKEEPSIDIISPPSSVERNPVRAPVTKTSSHKQPISKMSTEVYRRIIQEESEIRKLVTKKKRAEGLTKREQCRLLRLRERAKQRRMKSKLSEKQKDARHKENQAKWIQNLMKAREKQRLLQQQAKLKDENEARKYSQEHCYASWHAKLGAINGASSVKVSTPDKVADIDVTCDNVCDSAASCEPVDVTDVASPEMCGDGGEDTADIQVDSPNPQTDVNTCESLEKSVPPSSPKQPPPLPVSHRDQRVSPNRGKFQDGHLLIHLFKNRDSPCVRCLACQEMMNPRQFSKHLHRSSNVDELITVTVPQKLFLTNSDPTQEELSQWENFQSLSRKFDEEKRHVAQKNAVKKSLITSKTKDNLSKAAIKTPKKTNSQIVSSDATPVNCENSTRHSTRIRKRKQFHPMERYVFGDGSEDCSKKPKSEA